jgi:folate-dependent phosphoribosylglycinamide formyltransferase PurN
LKILILSGSHPRHSFVSNEIKRFGYKTAEIRMMREPLNVSPPLNILESDKRLFIHHFKTRAEIEEENFPTQEVSKLANQAELLKISSLELNSKISADFVRTFSPDVCIIFGTELIKDPLLSLLPSNTFNLHLGLSPWYRGSATLFWPFYMLQPQFAGVTIHKITDKPDAGKIYHQIVPELFLGQGIHDVAVAAVKASIKPLKQLISVIENDPKVEGFEPISTGRLWREKDFTPAHLRVIYEQFNNNIVDKYLLGELGGHLPKLLSVL